MRRADLKREDGVAMAEFALIAPVLLLIVAGMLGFGRALFYWIDANHMANETARWAVVDRNPFGTSPPGSGGRTLQQHVLDSGTLEFQNTRVCITFEDSTPAVSEYLTVKVQKPFDLLPILGIGRITIRGSSTMRIERFANLTGPTSYSVAADPNVGNIGTCT